MDRALILWKDSISAKQENTYSSHAKMRMELMMRNVLFHIHPVANQLSAKTMVESYNQECFCIHNRRIGKVDCCSIALVVFDIIRKS